MTIFEYLDYLTSNILLPAGRYNDNICRMVCRKENIDSELKIQSKILKIIWYFSARILAPLAVILVMLNALGININIFT